MTHPIARTALAAFALLDLGRFAIRELLAPIAQRFDEALYGFDDQEDA